MKFNGKIVQDKKIQAVSNIELGNSNEIIVSVLAFSRDEFVYTFDSDTYELKLKATKITHKI